MGRDTKLHLALAVTWTLLVIPTVLWWKSSILWVLIISLYANIIGHISAYQASKAEDTEKEIADDSSN